MNKLLLICLAVLLATPALAQYGLRHDLWEQEWRIQRLEDAQRKAEEDRRRDDYQRRLDQAYAPSPRPYHCTSFTSPYGRVTTYCD